MDTQGIIAELEAERDRLNEAIAALRAGRKGRSRKGRARRYLTAAERKQISDGMKAAWAKRKKRKAA